MESLPMEPMEQAEPVEQLEDQDSSLSPSSEPRFSVGGEARSTRTVIALRIDIFVRKKNP